MCSQVSLIGGSTEQYRAVQSGSSTVQVQYNVPSSTDPAVQPQVIVGTPPKVPLVSLGTPLGEARGAVPAVQLTWQK